MLSDKKAMECLDLIYALIESLHYSVEKRLQRVKNISLETI